MHNPHLIIRLFVLVVSALLSMFFSGSETALFSLPTQIVRHMEGKPGTKGIVAQLRGNPKRLLTTVLLGNMVVNVVFFSVSFFLIVHYKSSLSGTGAAGLSIASLLFVILFCELFPKNLAVVFARSASLLAAYPLLVFQKVFIVPIFLLEKLTGRISALFGRHVQPDPFIRSEELDMLIDLSEKEGVVEEDVGEMMAEVVSLTDVPVREIMIPRVEMAAHNIDAGVEGLQEMFSRYKHTLMPVYEGRMDNMLGAIHAKDFMLREEGSNLRELIREMPFMPETTSTEQVLRQMREEHSRMAFIVDEHGAVEGIVTIEDILEEIVGEIRDEFDPEEPDPVERIGEREFRLRGNLSIRDWQEAFEMDVPELSVDTIGGVVMALLGRLPRPGDQVELGNLEFEVEAVKGHRVITVILRLHEAGAESVGGPDD
ncbi:MAG: HlyC/CorC family transporter [Planctomycetes bacterium]|nr:HlyC/CorC family transporter [Planctomycetota bacterium]